jgi:hypothetical protein
MATVVQLFESPDLASLNFCLLCWLKREIYKRKVDTRDELLTRIFNAAVRAKA